MAKPFEAYSACRRPRMGASPLQSRHQCAQKNNRTGEPLSWARAIGFGPRYSASWSGGADLPTSASRFRFFCRRVRIGGVGGGGGGFFWQSSSGAGGPLWGFNVGFASIAAPWGLGE